MKTDGEEGRSGVLSGGLDTSIIIPWLKENYGCEIIALAGNVGQDDELHGIQEKAIAKRRFEMLRRRPSKRIRN